MHKAKVVVVQKVLEGLRQSFVWSAHQQTGSIIWRPVNTKLTSEHLQVEMGLRSFIGPINQSGNTLQDVKVELRV